MNNVQTTRIKKKYTDKQGKEQTLEIDYARVPTRIKAFRETNPRAKITTIPTINEGSILFMAEIITDLKDEHSARATGHSFGLLKNNSGDKAFEKLETIAVGRALAMLGYLNDGQVATTEETQDFEAYKEAKEELAIEEAKDKLKQTKNMEELKLAFVGIDPTIRNNKEIVKLKDELKDKLSKPKKVKKEIVSEKN